MRDVRLRFSGQDPPEGWLRSGSPLGVIYGLARFFNHQNCHIVHDALRIDFYVVLGRGTTKKVNGNQVGACGFSNLTHGV